MDLTPDSTQVPTNQSPATSAVMNSPSLQSLMKAWRFEPSTIQEEKGEVYLDGPWGYAGRWSDYAMDAPGITDDDDPEEAGEEWMQNKFRRDLSGLMKDNLLVSDSYLSDGSMNITLRKKP